MTENKANGSIHKVLILAPNWLGDAVMMTPLLDLLSGADNLSAGKKNHICLGIRNIWAPLFARDPRIDEIMLLDRQGRHAGVKGLLAQASLMRQGCFDSILLCPPSLRVGLAAWLAGIPMRIGYKTDGRSPFLTRRLKNSTRGQFHYSQEMMALGWSLIGHSKLPEFPLNTSLPGCDQVQPADLGAGPPVWVLAPGTTYGQAKTWPAKHVADLLAKAVGDEGVRVLLLGDKESQGFVDTLRSDSSVPWRSDLPGESGVIDLTGKTDLLQVVAFLKSAAAFVGNDSGLMHLAAAVGVPTVGIFGSSNPDWTAPVGRRTRFLRVEGFPCQPCYRKTCNQSEFCLDKLPASEVLAVLHDLLLEQE